MSDNKKLKIEIENKNTDHVYIHDGRQTIKHGDYEYIPVANTKPDTAPDWAVEKPKQRTLHEQGYEDFFRVDIGRSRTVAFAGETETGKSSLLYKALDMYMGKKPIVFYDHPNPKRLLEIRTSRGKQFFHTADWNQIESLIGCIVVLEEPQITFDTRQRFEILHKYLTYSRHSDNSLLFVSNDTRWFQAKIEAKIQNWICTDLDYDLVKRGSKIKKIMTNYCPVDTEKNFKLRPGQFLFYARNTFCSYNSPPRQCYTFDRVDWFDEALEKPYKSKSFPNMIVQKNEYELDFGYLNYDDMQ